MKTKKQNPPKGGTLTEEQIKWLNECTTGRWELDPQTGLVDLNWSFDCSEQGLSDFKGVRFGVFQMDFFCDSNQLTSLEGAPQKVRGGFYCHNNQLTSLVGAPREVRGVFSCGNNLLTSLKGAPQEVGCGFYCNDNLLTSLVGAPREIGDGFYCRGNPVPERTLKSIFSLMQEGASYEEVLREKWKEYSHELKSLLYRAEYQWIPQEEHKMLSALNKVNSVLKWI